MPRDRRRAEQQPVHPVPSAGPLQHQADWIVDRLPRGSTVRLATDGSWLVSREHVTVIVIMDGLMDRFGHVRLESANTK